MRTFGAGLLLLVLTGGVHASTLTEDFVSLAEDGQANLYGIGPTTGSPAGQLRRSTDAGTTWTAVEVGGSQVINTVAVEAAGSTVVAVGGNFGTIYRSGDEGQGWVANDPFTLFSGLTAVATDGNGNWLTVGDNGEPFVAESTNDGQNWAEVDLSELSLPGLSSFTGVAWDETAGLWLMVGVDRGDAIAVTYDPATDSLAEVTWPGSPPKAPSALAAVTADGVGDFLAVGTGGTVVHFTGLGTESPTVGEVTSGLSEDLHAVTFLPDGSFLAGGADTAQVSVSADGTTVLTLPGTPNNGSLQDYLVPAGARLPKLAVRDYNDEPILYADPRVAFGDRAVNASAASATVSLGNLGAGTLTVERVVLGSGAPFSFETTTVDGTTVNPPFDLALGEEALASVSFRPTSTDSFEDSLTFTTASAGTAATVLEGRGVPNPSFTSSFPTTEIVEEREFSYKITVSDPNYQDEIALSVSRGSLPPGLELIDDGGGNGTLSGIPEADSAGSYPFTIEASVEATGGTAEQPVNATVLTPPSLSLSGDLTFGEVATGTSATRTLTVSNEGGATMVVESVASDNARFTVATPNPTPFKVPGGGNSEVTVTFAPTAAESASSTISVDTATAGTRTATASGSGVVDPLATYLFGFGLTGADAAADADPDTDSKENLLEFAFGSDPASASSLPQRVASAVSEGGSSYPALSFQHRETDPDPTGSPFSVDGITYTVEGSTDLTHWNKSVAAATDPGSLPTPENGYQWITFRLENTPLSTSGAKGFLRVVVSEETGDE